ncbi:hypothetical protein [Longimicrobium terrae]|uniref:Uncharacterized protein n=1 Tax=Longimicrobium terrae TaxID=1639882 RepID=A0A841GYY9_9BACT|nr:hypothetical protein [Longimicrobium terrae]MBB4636509.1 hypothetical protein [Longimicrobium terrae]MBB6070967.1 hypothetical protein [Longimicrobium terrae]NNC28989.1 hypothetical protein [Longimicrobium terrae]
MAYREFTDDDGVFWQVWETRPGDTANVRAPFAGGWLTFESTGGRLRLRPIPHGWEDAPDQEMANWLRQAAHSGKVTPRDSPSPSETRASDAANASHAANLTSLAASSAADRGETIVRPAVPEEARTESAAARTRSAPAEGTGGNSAAADVIAALPESEAALLARTRAAVARAREVIRTIGTTVLGE